MQKMSNGTTPANEAVSSSGNLQEILAFKDKRVLVILAEESKCFQDGIAKISGLYKELTLTQDGYCLSLSEVEYHSRPGRYMMGSREICICLDDIKNVESG